jgi:hypothetical protein
MISLDKNELMITLLQLIGADASFGVQIFEVLLDLQGSAVI